MIHQIVQGIVFRCLNKEVEFLVVKRVPEDGGFWQAITGTIENNELAQDTLKRELAEEAGIKGTLYISDKLEEYFWEKPDQIKGRDQIFAVEVSHNCEVKLDPKEHTEFRWLPVDDAVKLLKYECNKQSMELVSNFVKELKK